MTRNSTLNKAEINAYADCVDFFSCWVNEAFYKQIHQGKQNREIKLVFNTNLYFYKENVMK